MAGLGWLSAGAVLVGALVLLVTLLGAIDPMVVLDGVLIRLTNVGAAILVFGIFLAIIAGHERRLA